MNLAHTFATEILAFRRELSAIDMRPNVLQHRVDGVMYTSAKLPARVGLELGPRVISLLGPGLARLLAAADSDEIPVDKLAAALVIVAERAMRDGLVPLALDLLARTQCAAFRGGGDGPITADRFDDHFAGEYLHLIKVCALVLAHNFRGPTVGVR